MLKKCKVFLFLGSLCVAFANQAVTYRWMLDTKLHPEEPERSPVPQPSTSQTPLKLLNVRLSHKVTNSVESCSICLELLVGDLIETTCDHRYHSDCLSQWFQAQAIGYTDEYGPHTSPQQETCPLCRKQHCVNNEHLEFVLEDFDDPELG